MKNKVKNKKTVYIAVAALFAALTTALTTIHLPLPSEAGYVHFGDAVIYLAASMIPAPYSIAAAALGGALADALFGFFNWAPFTFVIKAANTLPFVIYHKYSKDHKIVTWKTAALSLASGVITVVLYFFAAWVVYGTAAGAFADVPGSIVQAIGSTVIFIVTGSILDKTKLDLRG